MLTKRANAALAALGALTLFGGATGAAAAQGNPTPSPPVNNTLSQVDRMFITMTAQGNMFEVMSSQLALRRSRNENVRMVANMLIKEHSQAQQDLKPVAQANGVALPTQPAPKHRAILRRLSRLRGAAFDKAYMTAQVQSHLETIGLFQRENRTGRDQEAEDYARRYLNPIQNHTSMIVEAAKTLGVPLSQAARQYEKNTSRTGSMGGMNRGNTGGRRNQQGRAGSMGAMNTSTTQAVYVCDECRMAFSAADARKMNNKDSAGHSLKRMSRMPAGYTMSGGQSSGGGQ